MPSHIMAGKAKGRDADKLSGSRIMTSKVPHIWLQKMTVSVKVARLCWMAWNQLLHHGPWSYQVFMGYLSLANVLKGIDYGCRT